MADKNDVRVSIGGNNAGLAAALKDSDRLVSQFARNATGGLRSFTAGFGAALKSALSFNAILGTVAGTAGLGLLIKSSIDSADAIAKMADRTGLGIEALQELQYAAGLAGVGADQFGRAMERLNVAVGESGRGTGEAREAFKALGISVRDNDGRLKSNERVFNELADAIGRTASATARADAVNKIFGQRLGGQLLPLFKDGAGGIEALRREARELGVVLDTVMVREAEKAGDQLERVGTIIKTNLTRAVLALTPSILALSEAFIRGLQPAVQWIIQHLPDSAVAADELRRRYNELADTLERMTGMSFQDVLKLPGLNARFGEQAGEIKKLLSSMIELGAAIEDRDRKEALYTATIKGSGDANSELAGKIADLRKELQFEADQLGRTKDEQKLYELAKKTGLEVNDAFRAGLSPLIVAIEAEKAAVKEAADRWKEYEDRIKSTWETQRARGQAIFEETRTEAEKYQATLTELNDLLAAGAISQETYARAVTKAQDDMAGSGRDLKDVFKDVNVSMSNAFADAILEGKKFGDVIDGLVKDIGRLIIQTALLNAVRQGMSGLGGLFGSLGGGGGGGLTVDQGGTPAALTPSAMGNAFDRGRVIPFARGGILSNPVAFAMAGGDTGVAGEAGPEAVVPLGRDSQGRLGIRATAANVTVNITTPPGTTARSEQRDDGRGGKTIDVMIDEAVAGNIGNQGSRTHRAMRSTFGVGATTVGR